MTKLKRLADQADNVSIVECPVSQDELDSRCKDYPLLTPMEFAKKYRGMLYRPVKIYKDRQPSEIQINYCDNPFCKWYGLPQVRFDNIPNKPYRYRLSSNSSGDKFINCNDDPIDPTYGVTLNCNTSAFSNWSVAQEISRLTTINAIRDFEPQYQYHKDTCPLGHTSPFNAPDGFYRRGKSSSKSEKYQCKACKKITNVLPSREISTNYHQQRNDILPLFAKMLVSKTPVKRTCEMLDISPTTYYDKLEWLYRRCLEFLERHETKAFKAKTFDRIWLNTDKLIYHLNNVRMRGKGGKRYKEIEDLQFPTHIVISGDSLSRYVFRADVAFDYNVTLDDIERDTKLYKDDHLYDFSQKNGHQRFSYFPQPPTSNDTQSFMDYTGELNLFNRRRNYIDGLHVNSTYTTMAHFWLIKNMLKVEKWRFVTDEDSSIMTALYRIFTDEIKNDSGIHFLCKVEKNKKKKDAFEEWAQSRKDLIEWGTNLGYSAKDLTQIAFAYLVKRLQHHSFYKYADINGKRCLVRAKRQIEHPLPSIDEGERFVDITTNVSD